MRAEPECIPCILRQVLEIARAVAPDNEWIQRQALNRVMAEFHEVDFDRSPAEVSYDCLMLAHKKLGVKDPYREEKKAQNDVAMKLVKELALVITNTDDPLKTILKLALAGNVIDLGSLGESYNINSAISNVLNAPLIIDHYDIFKEKLDKSRTLLYILDNAGEIVFDKLLIKQMADKVKITAVVRKGPVLNDVTLADAEYVSLTGLVDVVDSGADCFGIPLHKTSAEFREQFQAADMIISKGQANYETLENTDRDIFFLMMAKCECVARHLEIKPMSPVLLYKERVLNRKE